MGRYEGVGSPHPPSAPLDAEPGVQSWMGRRARLSMLLVCLALSVGGLLASGEGIFATARRSSQSAHTCALGNLPALATVDFRGLLELRASLLAVMEPLRTRRYASGTVQPENMWSDDPPHRIASARLPDGRWPAGYEMRTWAGNGDDIAADVLLFATESQARTFFGQAAGAHCHRAGRAAPAPSPALARNLIWVNPDGPTEDDAFLLAGRRVYRIVDVRARQPIRPSGGGGQASVSIVDHLACSLAGAGCSRLEPSGSHQPA